jgi:ATP-dependent Clp protease protease subunit
MTANIVQAQYIILRKRRCFKGYSDLLKLSGGSVYAGLEFMTRCNTSTRCSYNLYRNGCFYGSGIVVRRCRKRSALPHSRVMIHQPSGGAQGVH